jgi:uncharacterized coiled-coil protein SlyX
VKNRLARLVFDSARDPKRLEAAVRMQAELIEELNARIAMLQGDLRRQRMLLQRRVVDRVSEVFEDFANDGR